MSLVCIIILKIFGSTLAASAIVGITHALADDAGSDFGEAMTWIGGISALFIAIFPIWFCS